MNIHLTTALDLTQNISLVISNGQALLSVHVFDEQGNQIEKIVEDHGEEDVVVYFQDNITRVKEEVGQLNKIEIFPNPTAGAFSLRMDWPSTARLELNLYDVYGNKVTRLEDGIFPAGKVALETSLLTKDILPGLYFLVVRKDGAVFGRERVVFSVY